MIKIFSKLYRARLSPSLIASKINGIRPAFRFNTVPASIQSEIGLEIEEETLLKGKVPLVKKEETQPSKEENKKEKENDKKKNEPKWMRFFKGAESLKVDLERSIKSDNQELLTTYVRNNYLTFDSSQLVLALPKMNKNNLFNKLLNEIKLRIILNTFECEPQTKYIMLRSISDSNKRDPLISRYLVNEFCRHFDRYSLKEQTDILFFFFSLRVMQFEKVRSYSQALRSMATNNQLNDYLQNLTEEETVFLLEVISSIYRVMSPDQFAYYFSSVVPHLYEKFISNISLENSQIPIKTSFSDIDRILPNTVPDFFNYEQDLKAKFKINELIFEKFNVDKNLGKYMHMRSEKSSFKILREFFQRSDRYLLEKTLYLLTVHIAQNLDLRYDFKMFPIFSKMSIAYKFYLDEALFGFQNILRNYLYNIRKSSEKFEMDHQSFFMINNKWRVFNDLNYEDILKEGGGENTQLKSIWRGIKQEYIATLENYVSSLMKSNFFEKIRNVFLLEVRRPNDLNVSFHNQNDITGFVDRNFIKQMFRDESLETNDYISDDDEGDKDKIKTPKEEGGSSPTPETDTQTIAKNMGELEVSLIKKMEELFFDMNKQKIFSNVYERKLETIDLQPIKWYMMILEVTTSLFYMHQVEEDFCHEVLNFLQKEENQKILSVFYMSPRFMENLIAIHEYFHLKKKKKGLPLEISVEALALKDRINSFLSGKEYEVILSNLEAKAKDHHLEELLYDPNYDVENFFYEGGQNYSLVNKKCQERIQDNISNLYPEFKLEHKDDLFSEKFRNSEENFLKKLVLSKAFQNIVNESYLKKVLQRALTSNNVQYVKNYVDYPAFADFLIKRGNEASKETLAILILDPSKLVLGVENTVENYYKFCQKYFEMKEIKVIFVKYSDYMLEEEAFLKKLGII